MHGDQSGSATDQKQTLIAAPMANAVVPTQLIVRGCVRGSWVSFGGIAGTSVVAMS